MSVVYDTRVTFVPETDHPTENGVPRYLGMFLPTSFPTKLLHEITNVAPCLCDLVGGGFLEDEWCSAIFGNFVVAAAQGLEEREKQLSLTIC
jgi:hypothetical protein